VEVDALRRASNSMPITAAALSTMGIRRRAAWVAS